MSSRALPATRPWFATNAPDVFRSLAVGLALFVLAVAGIKDAHAAPAFQAAGAEVSATGNVDPAWPTHAVDDVALLFVESAGGEAATLSTAAGFVQVTNSPQNTGTTTNGTRITVFWARATSTSMATPRVSDPGNHVYARILTYRGVINTGNPWDITGGGVKAAASTSVTVTGVTTSVPDTLVVQAVARDDDTNGAEFSAQANAALTGLTERTDAGTTSGNGGGFAVWDGVKAAPGATGNTTATVVSSINAFLTIALKPQPPTVASISRTAGNPVIAGASASWTVVFSEAVSGVDATDFTLVAGGSATGGAITVTPVSGTTYTVTTTTGAGGGTLGLNLADNDSIIGAGGTPLGGSGAANGNFTGAVYSVFSCTQPSNTPGGLTLTCVCDTFGRASLNPSTIFGGNWSLSNSDGIGNPYIHGTTGYLRLSENTANNAKSATVPGIFPAAGNYISVEFGHYAYNGSNPGADGLAVTLSDNSIPAVPGGFGGSLGYAQRNDGVSPPGFAGGWVGVALDEWGNYQNPTEGRVLGSGFIAQSVGVRGPGSGTNGYRWMAGTVSNFGGLSIDNSASATPAPGYMYQVVVDARNFASGTVNVSVNRDSTTMNGSTYSPLFAAFNAYTEANYALGQGWITSIVPNYWKVSFTGATGGANNIHEIGSLRICAQTVLPTTGGTASGFSAIDDAYPGAPTVPAYPNFQTGHIYTKLTGVPFSLWVAALTGSGISTAYSAVSAKYVQVKLVDNTDNACGTDSARTCSASCTNKAAVEAGATQIATFVSGSTTGTASPSPTFTLNSAYRNLLAVMKECTTSTCAAFTATTPACSADSFSVRPTGFSSVTSSDATNGTTSGSPIFKAGSGTFSLALTSAGVAGFPSKYNGTAKVIPTVVAPATVAGTLTPAAFAAATSGTPSSTVTGSFTYSEVGAFKLLGYNPATDTTSQRGVYDGAQCAALPAAACDAIKSDGTVPTWTAIDSISTENDCISDSYSNTKVGGKYGCNFGLTADSASIGRFTPDHFGLAGTVQTRSDLLPTTGSGFTYMGEPFLATLTLTAYNAADVKTQNYAGSLAKLDATTLCNGLPASCGLVANQANWFTTGCSGASQCMGLGAVNAAAGVSNRLAINTASTGSSAPSSSWTAGAGTFSAFLSFSRPTTLVSDATWGPFDALSIGGTPRDSDGVTLPAAPDTHAANLDATTGNTLASNPDGTSERRLIAVTAQRFGRLRLLNVYGSELLPIRLDVRGEYWDGSRWLLNGNDSLTTIPVGGVTASGGIAANTCFLTNPRPAAPTNASCLASSPAVTLASGAANWFLFDRTTPQTGFADLAINLAAMPWLQGKWTGAAAAHTDNPVVRIKFGSPKAPYIYLRERY